MILADLLNDFHPDNMVQDLESPVSGNFSLTLRVFIPKVLCSCQQCCCDELHTPSIPVIAASIIHLLLLIADLALSSLSLATWILLPKTTFRKFSFHYQNHILG